MAKEPNPDTQNVFLRFLCEKQISLTVFLLSGVKLQGCLSGFDDFSLLLRRGKEEQLVYKHAVATLVPATIGGTTHV